MDFKFYVYILFDLCGIPRYVGKGHGKRWRKARRKDNPRVTALIKRNGLIGVIARSSLSEAEAFETEKAFIAAIGRENKQTGPLYNFTDGGEGTSGKIVTAKVRKAVSRANKGRRHSDEARARMRLAQKGRKHSEETKAKIAAAQRGRKASAESRAKQSLARKGRKMTPEWRAKLTAVLKREKSPEHKAKLRARLISYNKSAKRSPKGGNMPASALGNSEGFGS